MNMIVQFGTSGLTGAGAMLHVAEAQPVDQELVKMELSVISAVKLATIQKQLFVKTKTAQCGTSGLTGPDATLPAVEVRRVDQELVKTEMPGRLAVISVKHQKQMFVMNRTAQFGSHGLTGVVAMSHAEGVKPVDCAHVLMEIPVMLVVTWAELQKEKIAIIKIVQSGRTGSLGGCAHFLVVEELRIANDIAKMVRLARLVAKIQIMIQNLATNKPVHLVKRLTEDVLISAIIRAALMTGQQLITPSYALVETRKCSIQLIAKLVYLLVTSETEVAMKIVTGQLILIVIVPVICPTFLTQLTQLNSTVRWNYVNLKCTAATRKLLALTLRTVLFVNVTVLSQAMDMNVPSALVTMNAGHSTLQRLNAR